MSKELEQLILSKSRPVQKEVKQLQKSELDRLITEALLGEVKATGEQQEIDFVNLINQTFSSNEDKPFTLDVGGTVIKNVTGAEKKEGKNDFGKEPYVDVYLTLASGDKLGLSLKGGAAPSLIGGGVAGINHLYPNILKKLAPLIIKAYVDNGYAEGKAWATGQKSMKRLAKKVLALTKRKPKKPAPDDPRAEDRYEKQRAFFGARVILRTIDPKNKVEEYPLYPDAPRGDAWGPNGLPSVWSTAREFSTFDSEGDLIYITSNIPSPDATKAELEEAKVKDLYIKIEDADCLKKLFTGDEAMGGPVDYLYKGKTMKVSGVFDNGVLKIPNDQMLTAEQFVQTYGTNPGVYFRIRKRGFDSAFTVAKTPDAKRGIGGYKIFTTGRYSGEGARVVTSQLPKNTSGVIIGPPLEKC